MVTAPATRTPTRGLAGTPLPPADPIFTAGDHMAAARLLAASDGVTLHRLKLAALALKCGREDDARILLGVG